MQRRAMLMLVLLMVATLPVNAEETATSPALLVDWNSGEDGHAYRLVMGDDASYDIQVNLVHSRNGSPLAATVNAARARRR